MSNVDPALAEKLLNHYAALESKPAATPEDVAQFIAQHNAICYERMDAIRDRDEARALAMERFSECEEAHRKLGEPYIPGALAIERDTLRAQLAAMEAERDSAERERAETVTMLKAAIARAEAAERELANVQAVAAAAACSRGDSLAETWQNVETNTAEKIAAYIDEYRVPGLGDRIRHGAWRDAKEGT